MGQGTRPPIFGLDTFIPLPDNIITSKIIKNFATRCHILRLKIIKFDFDWGSAASPLGELTALPRPLDGFQGLLLMGWRERMMWRGEGEEERERICHCMPQPL